MNVNVYRVLGQSNPLVTTLTDAYTVTSPVRSTIVSSIVVANRSATPTSFRLSVAVNGEANDLKQYIAYDTPIGANESITFPIGITMLQGDVIRVYATLATLSFNIFGVENNNS